jgi:hypothetical protein
MVLAVRASSLAVLGWVLLVQLPVLVGGYGPVLGAGAGMTVGVVAAVAMSAVLGLCGGRVVAGPGAGLAAVVVFSAVPAAGVRQADPAAAGRPQPRAPDRRGCVGAG